MMSEKSSEHQRRRSPRCKALEETLARRYDRDDQAHEGPWASAWDHEGLSIVSKS